MVAIPKKVSERFIKKTNKFQKVLKNASDRDVNEADTVTIISDILYEVFGFDKYSEITSEFAIRGTYCDLAVKIKDDVKYLKGLSTLRKWPPYVVVLCLAFYIYFLAYLFSM